MKALLLLLLALPTHAEILPAPVRLSTGTNNVGTVSGSSVAAQQLGPWSTSQQGSYVVTPGTGAFPAAQSGVWAVGAAQQGSYTVTPGTGTWGVSGANAGSYTVTPGTGTFPISAAALPLPAGAATEATAATLFKAGQSIGNTAFGASQLGAYTTTPGTGTWAVSGAFFQAVQPTTPMGSMTVTPGTGTFPVSGNVTVAGSVNATQLGSYTTTPGTGTWPVSGAFFQSVQTVAPIGSLTVTPGTGTWATNASQAMVYTVTPGTGTFPVSAASLPLPAGAATEATAAAISSNAAAGFRQGQTIGNTSFIVYQSSPEWQTNVNGVVTVAIASGANQGSYTVTPGTGTFEAHTQNSVTVTPGTGTFTTAQAQVFTVSPGTGSWNGQTLGSVTVTPGTGTANVNVTTGSMTAFQGGIWSVSGSSVTIFLPASFPTLPVVSTTPIQLASSSVAVYNVAGSSLAVNNTSATPLFVQQVSSVTAIIFLPATLPTLPVVSTTSVPTGSNNIGTVSGSSVAVFNVAGTSLSVHQADANFSVNNSSVTDIPIQKTQAARGGYFAATTNIVSMAVAETPLFLFVNVATNTVSAYVDVVDFINSNIGTGVGASNSVFRVYRAPVVTSSGTALGEFNGDSGSANVSAMQSFLSPTLSSNGTLVFTFAVEGATIPRALWQSRIIRPGAKIVITVSNTIAATPAALNFSWSEE